LLGPITECTTRDGQAVLAGMLVEEREAMERVFDRAGWRVEASESENAWWTATIARR
jgi:ribosomal protein L11 methylase PrmA